jgi:hypothetical protein
MKPKPTSREIMPALITQVMRAAGPTPTPETEVKTYISRGMWTQFLIGTGMTLRAAKKTNPTGWIGIGKTHRVYGSETIVIESPELFSWSVRPKPATSKQPKPRHK